MSQIKELHFGEFKRFNSDQQFGIISELIERMIHLESVKDLKTNCIRNTQSTFQKVNISWHLK